MFRIVVYTVARTFSRHFIAELCFRTWSEVCRVCILSYISCANICFHKTLLRIIFSPKRDTKNIHHAHYTHSRLLKKQCAPQRKASVHLICEATSPASHFTPWHNIFMFSIFLKFYHFRSKFEAIKEKMFWIFYIFFGIFPKVLLDSIVDLWISPILSKNNGLVMPIFFIYPKISQQNDVIHFVDFKKLCCYVL